MWVAILAAYVLVLQALLGGLAGGARADAARLDQALAMSLCLPGGDLNGLPGDTGKGLAHADKSCCTAGCPMLGGTGPAPAGFSPLAHRPADHVAFSRRLDRPVGYLAIRSPGSPRAPPFAG
ncbi:hypothetical protein ABE438_18745 [Bosea sp. TWI1241]|uniref:hypothetical protein n=1 Tax=Bosea sp. TWI1241 TaxID=3148904 RepID=UPI003208BADA